MKALALFAVILGANYFMAKTANGWRRLVIAEPSELSSAQTEAKRALRQRAHASALESAKHFE